MAAHDLAIDLSEHGHRVTVIAPFPNRPSGRLVPGFRRKLRRVDEEGRMRVVRVWHTLSRRSTIASRGAENLSFGITAALQVLIGARPDVVFMNTWPLVGQLLLAAVCRIRRVPLICVVHDVYPETLFTPSGRLGALVHHLLVAVDGLVYRLSTKVTALNHVQADHLAATRDVPADKLVVIPDWVHTARFTDAAARDPLDARDRDVVSVRYVGALTRMAQLDTLLDAAAALRHRDDIRFDVVGDGAARGDLERRIEAHRLTNVTLDHPLRPEDVPAVQAAADVLVLSLAPGPAGLTTPSKLLFYLASGRPVVAAVGASTPTDEVLRASGAGLVVEAGDGAALAGAIVELCDDRSRRIELGRRAAAHAAAHFDREVALPRVRALVESVATNGR